jgi:hypothetical protein
LKTSAFGITDNNLDFDNHKQEDDKVIPKKQDSEVLISENEINTIKSYINHWLFPADLKDKALSFVSNPNSTSAKALIGINHYDMILKKAKLEFEKNALEYLKNSENIDAIQEKFYGVEISDLLKLEIDKKIKSLK